MDYSLLFTMHIRRVEKRGIHGGEKHLSFILILAQNLTRCFVQKDECPLFVSLFIRLVIYYESRDATSGHVVPVGAPRLPAADRNFDTVQRIRTPEGEFLPSLRDTVEIPRRHFFAVLAKPARSLNPKLMLIEVSAPKKPLLSVVEPQATEMEAMCPSFEGTGRIFLNEHVAVFGAFPALRILPNRRFKKRYPRLSDAFTSIGRGTPFDLLNAQLVCWSSMATCTFVGDQIITSARRSFGSDGTTNSHSARRPRDLNSSRKCFLASR